MTKDQSLQKNHKKPLIGIAPCYAFREKSMWHMVKEAYSYAVWDAQGIPMLLTYPNSTGHVGELLSSVDGVLMIGGPDLPIELYGGRPYDLNGEDPMHPNRIEFDRTVFNICKKQGKPVFGICAGFQHINVIHSGTLYEDIPSQLPEAIDHGTYKGDVISHPVEVDQNSLLFDVVKQGSLPVNSTHHQGIRELGQGLKAAAWSSDGLIEAIESVNGEVKFIAVQWHPELMKNDDYQRKIFRWLIEEARTNN